MGRSLKKGLYTNEKLLKKVLDARAKGDRKSIKTWARSSVITPEMVGASLSIHNGRGFFDLIVSESMVGHKIGEFALTRRFTGHSQKGKIAKSTGSTGRGSA